MWNKKYTNICDSKKKEISDFENWKLIILKEKIFDGMEFSRNIIIIHNILYILW